MKQSHVLGHPEPFSVKQSDAERVPVEIPDGPDGEGGTLAGNARRCVICRAPRKTPNALTCSSSCALKRKTQLQRLRRWRTRR